jgi:HD-GYP domain-containing protein (c-di-GMP phosphodiesterase class II)
MLSGQKVRMKRTSKINKLVVSHSLFQVGVAMQGSEHVYTLDSMNRHVPLKEKLVSAHETINGAGYPSGKTGEQIPLEARIVAVADIFDALTSIRPYKEEWTNVAAIETLKQMAGERLDHDCVNALSDSMEEVVKIQ